jgi:hypothetical protein
MSGPQVNPTAGGGTSAVVGAGYMGPLVPNGSYNQHSFVINQHLGRTRTTMLVKVVKVTSNGEVAAPGVIDVQPLVNQVDGSGNQKEHGTIFNVPYVRGQGGDGAVINDPKVGDIGLVTIFDRDSSAAIAAKGKANPGSNRRFSPSDAVYHGGIVNDTPVKYVRFFEGGIEMGYGSLKVRITDAAVILGNPDQPLFNVSTVGGPSLCVQASLIK